MLFSYELRHLVHEMRAKKTVINQIGSKIRAPSFNLHLTCLEDFM